MEQEANLVELDFRRDENKFFVPKSHAGTATQKIDEICSSLGYIKEQHRHPITRSVYYYFGDTDTMPPGFSVRYREYVDGSVALGAQIGENEGFYEIKWFDQFESGRPIKKKLRFQGDFQNELSFDAIQKMVSEGGRGKSFLSGDTEGLNRLLNIFALNGLKELRPLFFVEYERSRYVRLVKNEKNVVSVDNNVLFYQFTSGDKQKQTIIKPLGGIDGCVVEYKESYDDILLRWRLYRQLVTSNASRFYGKKGEALNILQRERSKTAPPIVSEINGLEIESKLDIFSDLQSVSQLVTRLYEYFDSNNQRFTITPGFAWMNSQSTMATYTKNRSDSSKEGKLLVGLEGKYSEKQAVSNANGVIIRKEKKGHRFEYDRRLAREALGDMKVAGKTQRIRRAFYISSCVSNRVYKISIDFNWKLPIQENDFFSQLEVEYTGRPIEKHEKTQSSNSVVEEITKEVVVIREEIKQMLLNAHISFESGGRKADKFNQ